MMIYLICLEVSTLCFFFCHPYLPVSLQIVCRDPGHEGAPPLMPGWYHCWLAGKMEMLEGDYSAPHFLPMCAFWASGKLMSESCGIHTLEKSGFQTVAVGLSLGAVCWEYVNALLLQCLQLSFPVQCQPSGKHLQCVSSYYQSEPQCCIVNGGAWVPLS